MRKTLLGFAALCIAGSAPALAAPLLLISLDGLAPRYVLEADALQLKIPHLRTFMRDGAYATGVVSVLPTLTYPNHTTMITGVAPNEHGITSNTVFDPMQSNRDGWYWYAQDIRTPTLWSAAAKANLSSAAINWPVTVGERNINTLLPEFWRTSTPDDLKLIRVLAQPAGRLEQLEAKLGPFVDGNQDTLKSDEVRTKFALAVLREDKPQFMAVHLVALDGTEHHDGPFQKTAYETLEALDGMVGELTSAALANDPATIIVIVSDHGFLATHTTVNLRTRFVEAGLIRLKAPPQPDVVPTVDSWDAQIWPAAGTAAVMLKNPQDAALRAKVATLLKDAAKDPRNGIARVLDSTEITPLGGFKDAAFLVEFGPGFYAGTDYRGPLLTPGTYKGTHGYLPQRPELHASFFAKGQGVASKKNLGVVDMRQVAPTLAQILGVPFATAKQAPLPIRASAQALSSATSQR